jgi:hypothetical protein
MMLQLRELTESLERPKSHVEVREEYFRVSRYEHQFYKYFL